MHETRDCSIEWMDTIPAHWEVLKNKYLMHKEKNIVPNYGGEDILSLTTNGVIVRDLENPSGKMPTTFDGYQQLMTGNLLMCLFDIDVTPRCIGRIKNDGLTSPAYSQFVLTEKANQDYYYYYYLALDYTKELLHLAKNLRHSLSEDQFGVIEAPVPPIEEQREIARILDKKFEQIDALIDNQEYQIEKLKVYKQSLFTEIVTKGLNSSAEVIDSGIGWLGKVPKNWNVMKMRNVVKNKTVKGHGDATVLSVYRDWGVIPKDSRDDNWNVTSLDTDSYKFIEQGDLVINKMKAWSGSLAISDYSGIVSPAYYTCTIDYTKVDKRFFHHFLRNRKIVSVYEMYSAGMRAGQWDLGIDDFLGIEIAIPQSLEEQKEIADYLDKQSDMIDRLIEIKKAKIEKLEQYKKSLTYEYVTGKKEVM